MGLLDLERSRTWDGDSRSGAVLEDMERREDMIARWGNVLRVKKAMDSRNEAIYQRVVNASISGKSMAIKQRQILCAHSLNSSESRAICALQCLQIRVPG